MATGNPRYLTAVVVDPGGAVADAALPEPLPHGLKARDFVRTVEDVQDLIQDLNSLLASKSYSRLELLLDPAGYSGLISRTVADRLARASLGLVVNKHHNGYPDLIPAGRFPNDAVPKSDEGLEIKASRYESSWQSHGPRSGWFAVIQFEFDAREAVAPADREPTRVVAVMAAKLDQADWSWQPAQAGRIRSGTATVRASGMAKLRNGGVWVRPEYQAAHDELTTRARINAAQPEIESTLLAVLAKAGGPMSVEGVAAEAGLLMGGVPASRLLGRVKAALVRLSKSGKVRPVAGKPVRYSV